MKIRNFIFSYNGQYVIFLFFSVRLTTFDEIFYKGGKFNSAERCLRAMPPACRKNSVKIFRSDIAEAARLRFSQYFGIFYPVDIIKITMRTSA